MSAGPVFVSRVFVCTTCNRYAATPAGQATPGQCLALAMKRHAAQSGSTVAVRTVECLNGCPHPCTAALRAPGKMVIRFSELTVEDAPALLDAASRYAESPGWRRADGGAAGVAAQPKVSDRVSVPAA